MKFSSFKKFLQFSGLIATTIFVVVVSLFLAYQNPFAEKGSSAALQTVQAQTETRREDGAPCDASPVDGDLHQGKRLQLNPPDITPGDYFQMDVAKVYNERCLNGALETPYGGFSDGTVAFDVEDLINTFDATERADKTSELGTELSEFALYDNDITPTNSTPNAIDDFPFSCNSIFLRKQESYRGEKYRYEDRLSYGSFCCQNGWGTEEYLENPNDSYDGSTFTEPDENITNNRYPEPDSDGDPRNGYQGSMTMREVIQWNETTTKIDATLETIPATKITVDFTYRIPWPGLLFERLTLPAAGDIDYYRGKVVGEFVDKQKGNGQWDAASGGTCGSAPVPLPSSVWQVPAGESDWVVPTVVPCPLGTPQTDEKGNYGWSHDEPFQDLNHNGEYDCPSEDDCEPFADTGNGYSSGDEWTYVAPSLRGQVDPELVFNRQWLEIATSPREGTVARATRMIFYPVTNIEIRGYFQEYTPSECTCRDADRLDPSATDPNTAGDKRDYVQCEAVFEDTFDPELCGVCGANQPILNGGPAPYPNNAYCEDLVPRTTNLRWPPFTLNTLGLKWEISSGSVAQLFNSVLKDSTPAPSVNISVSPPAPKKGDTVHVAATGQNLTSSPEATYYSWTMNGKTQQGLVAGAEDRVEEHEFPPNFIITDPVTGVTTEHAETREFYSAPKRPPATDSDNDGLDDNWERRYFGSLEAKASDDADKDGHTASDFASLRVDVIAGDNNEKNYKENERFIQIVPGVWLVKGNGSKQFIAPTNFNKEWITRPAAFVGLTNIEEFVWGTSPTDPDTDDDGYADGVDLLGIGQDQWDFVSQQAVLSPTRDKIGVMVLGESLNTNEKDQKLLTHLVCNSKVVFPSNGDTPSISIQSSSALPIPGEPLTVSAAIASTTTKTGFFTFDWYVNGRQVVTGGKGQSTLTLSAQDTQSFQPGGYVSVRVVAVNPNKTQSGYGDRAEASKDILLGLRYDSLEVFQPAGTVIFPTKEHTDKEKGVIPINRFDDVSVSLTNVWPRQTVVDSLYFEWRADGILQSGKASGRGSGKGASYSNFTFAPKAFLPEGITDNDAVGKVFEVNVRAVDLKNQKEVMQVKLQFIYDNPTVVIQEEVNQEENTVTLRAAPVNIAKNTALEYHWKVDGVAQTESTGRDSITLPLLRASLGQVVQLTAANLGGSITKEVNTTVSLDARSLDLPWYNQLAFSLWSFVHSGPVYVGSILSFTFVVSLVFFAVYGIPRALARRQHA